MTSETQAEPVLASTPGTGSLRVLMISQHPYPAHPTLRRNVDELIRSGSELDVVCMGDKLTWGEPQPGRSLRVYSIPMEHRRSRFRYPFQYALFFLWAILVTTTLSIRTRYDVVQVDTLPDFLVFSALVPKLRRMRIILYIYDLMPEMLASKFGLPASSWMVRLMAWQEVRATRWADHVITVSRLFQRVMEGRGLNGVKVTLVANSHPLGEVREVPRAEPPFLVCQTTLIERYGVQVALRALAELKDSHPQLTLRVLGAGEYLTQLLELTKSLGLQDRVSFSGRYLPWHEAMAEVKQATVGIIPIIRDGYGEMILPNKVLELAGMGVPAVCSRLPGITEHFPPDSLAFCEPGDHRDMAARIAELLDDPVGAQEQARRAQLAMGELTWEQSSKTYLRCLYASAVPGAPHPRRVTADAQMVELLPGPEPARAASGELV